MQPVEGAVTTMGQVKVGVSGRCGEQWALCGASHLPEAAGCVLENGVRMLAWMGLAWFRN